MKNSPDPSFHQQLERQFMDHVERLLGDERLRVDTTRGRRAVTGMFRSIERGDHAVELKRLMSELGRPDRQLEGAMPKGSWMEVTLSQSRLFVLKETVGRLQVVCLSPMRELVLGSTPEPLGSSDVQKILTELSMETRGSGVPSTVVIVSTGGFEPEVSEMAERRADRTLILAQPNGAGGWKIVGPVETKQLVDLFDPEPDTLKRQRVVAFLDENQADLLSGGVSSDKVAAKTQLPLLFVEAELKSYAKDRPAMSAKRLDGRIVLFREGVSAVAPSEQAGESTMGIMDRVKALFSRKGDEAKKIAHLSEKRAALAQQRDRIYEDLSHLENKESDLREQFKASTSALTKRRLTGQLLTLRKDIERRQQMLTVIGQQANIVDTHLHNLELVKQGQTSDLPSSQELTDDAVKAEEILSGLQVDSEAASSLNGAVSGGLSDEEQALFEELEREAATEKAASTPEKAPPAKTPAGKAPANKASAGKAPASPEEAMAEFEEPPPVPPQKDRARPEPG